MTGWYKMMGFIDDSGELLGSAADNFFYHFSNY
jgi:hypothetical protein